MDKQNESKGTDVELPNRPYTRMSEAQRFIEGLTGIKKAAFYANVQKDRYPVREVGGIKIISTTWLRETFLDPLDEEAQRATG